MPSGSSKASASSPYFVCSFISRANQLDDTTSIVDNESPATTPKLSRDRMQHRQLEYGTAKPVLSHLLRNACVYN